MTPSICHAHSGLMADMRHLKEGQDRMCAKLDKLIDGVGNMDASNRAHREADMAELGARLDECVPREDCHRVSLGLTQKIQVLATTAENIVAATERNEEARQRLVDEMTTAHVEQAANTVMRHRIRWTLYVLGTIGAVASSLCALAMRVGWIPW